MKAFVVYLLFFGFLSCTSSSSPSPIDIATKYPDDSTKKYKQIIEGLKGEYVLYYRLIKDQDVDVTQWGMPKTDSTFIKDSIKYWQNYKTFFSQHKEFINWLLTFRYDTSHGLWQQYHNPISSNLSECHLPTLNNSRAAIILLENFLVGYNKRGMLRCFSCDFSNRSNCNDDKYSQIEKFVLSNKDKNIDELRQAWLTENYR